MRPSLSSLPPGGLFIGCCTVDHNGKKKNGTVTLNLQNCMLSEHTPDECEDEWMQNNADFKWLWMVSSATALENSAYFMWLRKYLMSYKKFSSQIIFTFGHDISLSLEELGPVTVFQLKKAIYKSMERKQSTAGSRYGYFPSPNIAHLNRSWIWYLWI